MSPSRLADMYGIQTEAAELEKKLEVEPLSHGLLMARLHAAGSVEFRLPEMRITEKPERMRSHLVSGSIQILHRCAPELAWAQYALVSNFDRSCRRLEEE